MLAQEYHLQLLLLDLVPDHQRATQLHADTLVAPGESSQRQSSPPRQSQLSSDCVVARMLAMSGKVWVEAHSGATPSHAVARAVLLMSTEEVRSGGLVGLG